MIKGISFRIYPTKEQRVLLSKSFGSIRFVYNWALDLKTKTYQTQQKSISRFELDKKLTELKKEKEWLKEVPSQVLQQSLSDLDSAYTKFFKEKKGYPKFKSKHDKQSARFPQGFEISYKQIKLPKLGKVKAKISKTLSGFKIKNITVTKTKTNKYFASICYDDLLSIPEKLLINENQAVGIDLGIKSFLVTSEGEEIENPKLLKSNLKRLKCLQKRLSRKKKNSKNRIKARITIAKKFERISNMRKDFLHKTSITLIRENQTICIESLNVEGMLKNHRLAQAIQDCSWSEFVRQLKYKAEWNGVNIRQIGRFYPSSKLCECGVLNKQLELKDRIWICKSCGIENHRDVLAAKNIKRFAFLHNPTGYIKEVYTGAGSPGESVESPTIVGAEKQKPVSSVKKGHRKESHLL